MAVYQALCPGRAAEESLREEGRARGSEEGGRGGEEEEGGGTGGVRAVQAGGGGEVEKEVGGHGEGEGGEGEGGEQDEEAGGEQEDEGEADEGEEVGGKRARAPDADVMPGSSTDSPSQEVDGVPLPGSSIDAPTQEPDQVMGSSSASRKRPSDMSLDELEANVGQILCDIRGSETAWGDVNENLELPIQDVKSARAEEAVWWL